MEKKKKRKRRCRGKRPNTLNKVKEVVLEIKSDVNNLRVEFNERVGKIEDQVKTLDK